MAKRLKIIFLGGVGEIGKNMTAIEYGDDIIVVDAGLSFPNAEEMPGIDYVIPDFSYLTANKEKVRAILITHGHEDHIGALPYVLKEIDAPVYGSPLAIGLLQHKLREHSLENVKTNEVKDRNIISVGCFRVEFVRVTHSIAGAFALAINTPKGTVFFTGDFKIDHTPIDSRKMDLGRIAEIGNSGVLLMLQDSTNVEREGFSMSEKCVGESLDRVFQQNRDRRIIVATFASNIHRVQQIINCALKYNRKIVFSGKSMENIAGIAHKIKELNYPEDQVLSADKLGSVPYDRVCILSTGTQGEPESALTRMSQDSYKNITISDTDTVILSASPIPGNEKMIYSVINNLYRRGAEVVYKALEEIHVSGHACREELKMMLALIRPKYFIPVHGEYRHLKQHAELAESMGIPKANIRIPEVGNMFDISKKGIKKMDDVHSGAVMLDASLLESSNLLLRTRKQLAEDGFVVVIVGLTTTAYMATPPIIITRGINIQDTLVEELKTAIGEKFEKVGGMEIEVNDAKAMIRKAVAKPLYGALKRRPMILPIIIEN